MNGQKKVYRRNYLTDVIFRVDFPILLGLSELNPPTKFQEKVSGKFPILNELKGDLLGIEVKRDSQVLKRERKISWEFLNKEKTKRILVDPEFVAVSCFKYEHFEDFFKTIKLIFETFVDLYPIKIAKRVGLRYINEIRLKSGDPLEWSGLIHHSLFSVSREFVSDTNGILRSMHLLALKENNYNLKFQFGLFNSEYPNPIARKEFILDYDCYINEEIDVSEIFEIAKKFNRIIDEWFEKSILDKLRKKMEVVK